MLGTRNALDILVAELSRIDLNERPSETIGVLLHELSIETDELRRHVNFIASRYTRNLVYRSANFELLLLCWSYGAASPIHDHGGAQCYMTVIDGTLQVDDFTIMSGGRRQGYAHITPAGSTTLERGSVDVRTSNRDLHRVSAPAEAAVSLHVYAKPLDRFMVFNQANRSCRTVFGRYDRWPANDAQRITPHPTLSRR